MRREVEIDTELADLYQQEMTLARRLEMGADSIHWYSGSVEERYYTPTFRFRKHKAATKEAQK